MNPEELDTRLLELVWHIQNDMQLIDPQLFAFKTNHEAVAAIKAQFLLAQWTPPKQYVEGSSHFVQ